MKEIKAPGNIPTKGRRVFLAGSIEMGAAELWQDRVAKGLEATDWIVLNPRRDDWDSSWVQSITHPQFREQVEWELQGLEEADQVIVYFDPNTKAPITLMELGFIGGYLRADQIMVVCPDGFYRKGNVDVFCNRHGIPQLDMLDAAIEYVAKLPQP